MNTSQRFQVTSQGNAKIEVVLYDAVNESYSQPYFITRAALAKLYSEHKVVGSKDGLTVIGGI